MTFLQAKSVQLFKQQRQRKLRIRLVSGILLGIAVIAAGWAINFSISDFIMGIWNGISFFQHMFPPDWSALSDLLMPALETILLALLATVLGIMLSLVFALTGAANLAPPWLRAISRFLIAVERGLPEIVMLLLLVAALGLGTFPGVVALAIGCVGMLGKLFADAIEEVPASSLEPMESIGATKLQVILFGIFPQVLPSFLTNAIFRFEINIRLSILLGAVGAGGIGYELIYAFQMLEYQRACTAIVLILLLVFLAERFSDYCRKRLPSTKKLI